VQAASAQTSKPDPGPAAAIQYRFLCQAQGTSGPVVAERVLDLTPSMEPVELDVGVTMPSPWPSPRITRYLSQAVVTQLVVPAGEGDGRAAALLVLEGPKQTYERWLLADDPTRNRLVSLIGFWRFMAVADAAQRYELLRQFTRESDLHPSLTVRRGDAVTEAPLMVGRTRELAEPKCRIKVVEVYPHLVLDPDTGRPKNLSDEPVNPAIRVELHAEGKMDERWVFARHPEMNTGGTALPQFEVTLFYPSARVGTTPDYVLVSVAGSAPEVFQRLGRTITTQQAALDEKVPIPESKYTFRVSRFVPAARLHEEYQMSLSADARPALRLEVAPPGAAPIPIWIELGKERVITTAQGAMTVEFNRTDAASQGGHP